MRHVMSVSPDIGPDQLAGWFIFNTWMQRQWGRTVHLELYSSFQAQRDAIRRDEINLIYANPFDAAMLVREKGFTALAAPLGKSDEVVIAVNADSPISVDSNTDKSVLARCANVERFEIKAPLFDALLDDGAQPSGDIGHCRAPPS